MKAILATKLLPYINRMVTRMFAITMDQTMVGVSALRGQVKLGDEAVLIGGQGGQEIRAETLADALGTIGYEVVTAISPRLPRISVRA